MARATAIPATRLLHIICVPPIVLTVIGFIWSIPVPAAFAEVSPWLNWATITIVLPSSTTSRLSVTLGMGAAIALGILAYIVSWLDTLAWPLWATCLVIFVIAGSGSSSATPSKASGRRS